jgi:hypothetical protein
MLMPGNKWRIRKVAGTGMLLKYYRDKAISVSNFKNLWRKNGAHSDNPRSGKISQNIEIESYGLVQTGKIPHVRIGKNVRVKEGDLQKWLEHNSSKATSIKYLEQETLYRQI